jgi:hypothetical protein
MLLHPRAVVIFGFVVDRHQVIIGAARAQVKLGAKVLLRPAPLRL